MQLLILQHPQEPRQPKGTVPLIEQAIPSCVVRSGLSWSNLSRAVGREVQDPRRWGVLYLGTGLPMAHRLPKVSIAYSVTKEKQIIPLPTLLRLEGLVLLDGNWKQAKTLWWRNSWLLKLQRLALLPNKPSAYSVLRREPRRECLSTIEAAALAYEILAGDQTSAEKLRRAFEEFLKPTVREIDKAPQKPDTEGLWQESASRSSSVVRAFKTEARSENP